MFIVCQCEYCSGSYECVGTNDNTCLKKGDLFPDNSYECLEESDISESVGNQNGGDIT